MHFVLPHAQFTSCIISTRTWSECVYIWQVRRLTLEPLLLREFRLCTALLAEGVNVNTRSSYHAYIRIMIKTIELTGSFAISGFSAGPSGGVGECFRLFSRRFSVYFMDEFRGKFGVLRSDPPNPPINPFFLPYKPVSQ